MTQPGGYQRQVACKEAPECVEGSPNDEIYGMAFWSYMVKVPNYDIYQVYGNNMEAFNHYLVLDTACQKTCCSTSWLTSWTNHVHQWGLQAKKNPCREPFEFGHGPTQFSDQHALPVSCLDGHPNTFCIIGASVIPTTNDILLLGSNRLLHEDLGAVIDLPNKKVRLTRLGCEVPILMLNGHLALDISVFPDDIVNMMFGSNLRITACPWMSSSKPLSSWH